MKRVISQSDYEILCEVKNLMGADKSLTEIIEEMVSQRSPKNEDFKVPQKAWFN